MQYFDKALAIDPKNINALNNKGVALAKLAEKETNTNPKQVLYYYGEGEQLMNGNSHYYYPILDFKTTAKVTLTADESFGIYTQSMIYFDKVLSIQPNDTDTLNNKCIILIKLGKYNDAIKLLDKVLTIDPKNVGALYNKGKALDGLGYYIEAATFKNKAHQINPSYSGDYINKNSNNPSPFSPAV